MSFSVSVGWGFAHIVSMSVGWLSAYQTCDIVTASSQFNLSDEQHQLSRLIITVQNWFLAKKLQIKAKILASYNKKTVGKKPYGPNP